jgi:hypothetical protein
MSSKYGIITSRRAKESTYVKRKGERRRRKKKQRELFRWESNLMIVSYLLMSDLKGVDY